jgi:hypothetical protein
MRLPVAATTALQMAGGIGGTVHAPQKPRPQPDFVPVRSSTSYGAINSFYLTRERAPTTMRPVMFALLDETKKGKRKSATDRRSG